MLDNMPQSPFLPGTKVQFAWDSTSLGYIKTCPRLYYYHMICGWVPKEESIHLRFGIEYHQAIHEYELLRAAGETFEDAVRIVVRELLRRIHSWDPDPTLKPYSHKNKQQLLQLVVTYLDEFRDDPCKTHILDNGLPAVELSFRFELDWGPQAALELPGGYKADPQFGQPYLLCGHLDRVVSFNGDLFVLDHKTTALSPSEYYFNQYDPNNQMTLYSFAGKVVLDTPLKGVIVEAAHVTIDKPMTFHRRPTYRSDDIIDEWLNDLEYHLNAAEAFAEANYWPMNDTACDKFGGCRFREICSKSPSVRERFLKAEFIQLPEESRWNPLRSR
jgi:PD-(D/E)XK nuclease superfamily